MKIAFVDTVYPAFLDSLPRHKFEDTYEHVLADTLSRQFGTSDFYSRQFRKLGWEAIDLIGNHWSLQSRHKTTRDHPAHAGRDRAVPISVYECPNGQVVAQIEEFGPDVVFVQDISFFSAEQLKHLRGKYLLAAQCSCPMPATEKVCQFYCVFSSFPHYVPRLQAMGVRAVYNPLAFEPSVLDTHFYDWDERFKDRTHDCVFIGGVGKPSHWKRGMETLETVAREIPTFKWWGYGVETLPKNSALHSKYCGQAWGKDMFEILLRSKIALCRHGEVSEQYANNMKLFEITGTGAMLLTDDKVNMRDFFSPTECATYSSPDDAVDKIRHYLTHKNECMEIAANGQARTLRDHTYEKRMATVSATLQEMLCPA